MTLGETVAAIALPQVEGFPSTLSQTGEPYEVIMTGGSKQEGELAPVLCCSERVAIKLWRDAFGEYAKGKSGTLYWRIRPELCSEKIGRRGFEAMYYYVYARLLISNKPILASNGRAA